MLFLSTWSGYWLQYNNRLRLYSSIHMFCCRIGYQLCIPLYPSRGWPNIHRCTCCELCRFWSCCFLCVVVVVVCHVRIIPKFKLLVNPYSSWARNLVGEAPSPHLYRLSPLAYAKSIRHFWFCVGWSCCFPLRCCCCCCFSCSHYISIIVICQ